jgi:hypothetical protein
MTMKLNISLIAVAALFVTPVHAADNTDQSPATQPVTTSTTAAESAEAQVSPPDRPFELTADQLAALEQLSVQGDHAEVANTHAALSKRQRKNLSEAGVHAFNIGFVSTLATLLIMAAPL